MHRAFVHLELNTDDVERAREFYRDVLGWSFNSVDVGGSKYVQIATPKPPGGGIQVKPRRAMASHWMPYVLVEDVLSTVTRARRAGGKVVVDRTVMPGFGVLAIMTDPTGATFAVWEVSNGKPVEAKLPAEADDDRRAKAQQRALERKQAYAERRAEAKARRAAAKEARQRAREERRAAAAEAKRKKAEAKANAEREAAQAAKQKAAAEKKSAAEARKKAAADAKKSATRRKAAAAANAKEKAATKKKAAAERIAAAAELKKKAAQKKPAGKKAARSGGTRRRGRR
jgi:predicted enzyme related to lactoylglutathione lyase